MASILSTFIYSPYSLFFQHTFLFIGKTKKLTKVICLIFRLDFLFNSPSTGNPLLIGVELKKKRTNHRGQSIHRWTTHPRLTSHLRRTALINSFQQNCSFNSYNILVMLGLLLVVSTATVREDDVKSIDSIQADTFIQPCRDGRLKSVEKITYWLLGGYEN